ncbi:hypothetical protein [Paenibacillus sp. FSL P4-0502]|uniref:hypothetical protein n=1 Tax=Paenibacillus sp. FSL P4-0502 TaxID=2975319 RepID=UPI0030F7120B
MEAKYTCRAVKYAPGEDFKISVALLIQFDVDNETLRNIVTHHFPGGLFLPVVPIHTIDEFVGGKGRYWGNFTLSFSSVAIIDKHNYQLDLLVGKIQGWITEEDLELQGVKSVKDFLKGDILINLIITNSIFKELDQYDAYYISVKLGN